MTGSVLTRGALSEINTVNLLRTATQPYIPGPYTGQIDWGGTSAYFLWGDPISLIWLLSLYKWQVCDKQTGTAGLYAAGGQGGQLPPRPDQTYVAKIV